MKVFALLTAALCIPTVEVMENIPVPSDSDFEIAYRVFEFCIKTPDHAKCEPMNRIAQDTWNKDIFGDDKDYI